MKVLAVKGGSICRIGDYTLYEMPSNCVFNIGNTGVHTLYNMNRIEELVALSIRGKVGDYVEVNGKVVKLLGLRGLSAIVEISPEKVAEVSHTDIRPVGFKIGDSVEVKDRDYNEFVGEVTGYHNGYVVVVDQDGNACDCNSYDLSYY